MKKFITFFIPCLVTPALMLVGAPTPIPQGAPINVQYNKITTRVVSILPTVHTGGFANGNFVYSCSELDKWGLTLNTTTGQLTGSLSPNIYYGFLLIKVSDQPNESGHKNTAEIYIEIDLPYSDISIKYKDVVAQSQKPFEFNIGISGGFGGYTVVDVTTGGKNLDYYNMFIDNNGVIHSKTDSGCSMIVSNSAIKINVVDENGDNKTFDLSFSCISYEPSLDDLIIIDSDFEHNGSFEQGFLEFNLNSDCNIVFNCQPSVGSLEWTSSLNDPQNPRPIAGLSFNANNQTLSVSIGDFVNPNASFRLTVENTVTSWVSSVTIFINCVTTLI